MSVKKIILFLSLLMGNSFSISAQVKKEYLTVAPVTYLDTSVKPTLVTNGTEERSAIAESKIKYDSRSAVPQANLSIGKASAVYTTVKANKNAVESDSLQYHEQNIHIEETPVNSSSVQPK